MPFLKLIGDPVNILPWLHHVVKQQSTAAVVNWRFFYSYFQQNQVPEKEPLGITGIGFLLAGCPSQQCRSNAAVVSSSNLLRTWWLPAVYDCCHSLLSLQLFFWVPYTFIRSLSRCILFLLRVAYPSFFPWWMRERLHEVGKVVVLQYCTIRNCNSQSDFKISSCLSVFLILPPCGWVFNITFFTVCLIGVM